MLLVLGLRSGVRVGGSGASTGIFISPHLLVEFELWIMKLIQKHTVDPEFKMDSNYPGSYYLFPVLLPCSVAKKKNNKV